MGRTAMVMLAASTAVLGACEGGSLVPDPGGGGGTGGIDGGPIIEPPLWAGKLSDFEDLAGATIVQTGSPPRNGFWYTYNDGTATCAQLPPPMTGSEPPQAYVPEVPPTPSPSGTAGSLALHARWTGCTSWGAGIGADINVPVTSGDGLYTGPKVPYELTPYGGIMFWAMATPGSDVQLRVKLPMVAETRVEDGGSCVQSSTFQCGDDWGEVFSLPSNGNWKQITVLFDDRFFQQEGWGALFPWNPHDVTSIQIQAVDRGETYDFWIDDVYLIP
jgi:hypothetical protein